MVSWSEMKFKVSYALFKLTKPFRTFTYIHERTKITVRQFPFKFEIERVISLQERIDMQSVVGGGVVPLEKAIYVLDESIQLKSGIRLKGNESVIKVEEK